MSNTYYKKLYYQNGNLKYEGMGYDSDSAVFMYHGNGKSYNEEGSLIYDGEYKNNKWHGKGKYYHKGTLVYDCEFVDGDLYKGTHYYLNGMICYDGYYKDDEYHGYGVLFNSDGTFNYRGEFTNGEPSLEQNELNANITNTKTENPKSLQDYLDELNEMIGLKGVKEQVNSLVNLIRIQKERKERGLPVVPVSYHLVFTGNPGTGKTTVARLLSKIYNHLGITQNDILIETDRAGLVAGYVGQTAIKTDEVIQKALGGILFIDEAYTLSPKGGDQFGEEAIDCILKRMEDSRDNLVVIVAGYKKNMEFFLNTNPGLKSRFNTHILFENYSGHELMEIFEKFTAQSGYILSEDCKELLLGNFLEKATHPPVNFSNGRFVRNIFEKIVYAQSNRLSQQNLSQMEDGDFTTITLEDLKSLICKNEFEDTY